MSNPSDWMPINFNDVSHNETSPTTTSAAVATTAAATSRASTLGPDQARVARPIRRRSRASRRTPTTLLNTDTTNFRAMVQQFTGSPTTPSAVRSQLSNTAGMFDYTQHIDSAAARAPPASGFRVLYPNQMQHHMFMVSNMHGGGESGGGGGGSSHGPPESSSTNENDDYDSYLF